MAKFRFVHNNINVLDLLKSLCFYQEALGLSEVRRIAPEDGSFIIVYLSAIGLRFYQQDKNVQKTFEYYSSAAVIAGRAFLSE